MMTRDEKNKASRLIVARACEIRGSFLNRVAEIEKKIAEILVEYFCRDCPKKKELFFDGVATASFFGLRRKKDLLVRILKQDYPRYWEAEKVHFKAFDKVSDFRNRLAHCTIDLSEDALCRPLVDGIAFIDRDNCEPITDADLNEFEVYANMILSCLSDIERLLPFKEVPISPQFPLK